MENEYTSDRIIDGKRRKVIVDKNGKIVNRNPSKEECKGLEKEVCIRKQKYTKNQLLELMIQFSRDTGRAPKTYDFINNPKYPGFKTYQRYFGSWDRAIEAAGLFDKREIRRECIYTDEDLIGYLKNFEKENGRSPTAEDFNNNPKCPGFTTYQRHFGSWNKAIEAAGLNINCLMVTDDELLGCLMQFFEDTGMVPTELDFSNHPRYPSCSTYYRHFGNWSNALRLVGLDVDSMVSRGVLKTTQQRGRFAEIMVRDHFKSNPIDLSGNNYSSPCDGICPNGKMYEVKGSKFNKIRKHWTFCVWNKYKENIEIYYFLAFNEDYTKIEHAWRVPGEIVEKDLITVVMSPSDAEFTTSNMEEYDITEILRNALGIDTPSC